MSTITLTDDQMTIFREALSPVQVCDPAGKVLATIAPELNPEFIAEMKRRARAPGPRYTGEQVQNHLKALQEAWDREGPFDRDRMFEILDELRAAEQE